MKNIIALVEGQTEEVFIKKLLSPYLCDYGIIIKPTILNTKIIKGGNNFKGGINNYNQVKRDLDKLIKDKSIYITTFFDYYGLPTDFPGFYSKKDIPDPYDKVRHIENEFRENIHSERFIPHIQLHEFEALLFSDVSGFEKYFKDDIPAMKGLRDIVKKFSNPELINDDPETAPSKRIKSLIKTYSKPIMGLGISSQIGINKIIQKCEHFSNWIEKLKDLPRIS